MYGRDWRPASLELAAEYSTQIETTSPKVSYLTTDHLGSPRIVTNAAGGVISRKDFTAFGEEVFTAQRVSGERNMTALPIPLETMRLRQRPPSR